VAERLAPADTSDPANALENQDLTASPRKIAVAAQTTTGGLQQNITQAVATRLQALATAPTVRVTVKTEGG